MMSGEFSEHAERPVVAAPQPPTSWAPVALAPVLAGEMIDPPPSMLLRTDGRALLYAGRIHTFQAEPEGGKSWLAVAAAREVISRGDRVLFVDFEDTAASVAGRLVALGLSPEDIDAGFVYVRPDEPMSEKGRRDLEAGCAGVTLAICDGVTEALTLHGLDLASNTDVAKWLELLPRPLARMGAAVVLLDHVTKDKEGRGRYAIGAQHKLAGVDSAYILSVLSPFGRGREGLVKVTVTKDRPGHVREIQERDGAVALVRLTSDPDDGSVTVAVDPPNGRAGSSGFRPTFLMERLSLAIEAEPGLTKRALRTSVKGKHDVKDLALELLATEGYIDARPDGQSIKHYPIRAYREESESSLEAPEADWMVEEFGEVSS